MSSENGESTSFLWHNMENSINILGKRQGLPFLSTSLWHCIKSRYKRIVYKSCWRIGTKILWWKKSCSSPTLINCGRGLNDEIHIQKKGAIMSFWLKTSSWFMGFARSSENRGRIRKTKPWKQRNLRYPAKRSTIWTMKAILTVPNQREGGRRTSPALNEKESLSATHSPCKKRKKERK